jgi:hypothetical protein
MNEEAMVVAAVRLLLLLLIGAAVSSYDVLHNLHNTTYFFIRRTANE